MELYTSSSSCTKDKIISFLGGLDLPALEISMSLLMPTITAEEIKEVIRTLQSGKAPGPDRLTAEFFKCFSNELTPVLLRMYNEALGKGELPPT